MQMLPFTFRAVEELELGQRWRTSFSERWPHYRAWFLREGEEARPSYATSARTVPDKAVLVPTAERDPAAGLAIFRSAFRNARALMYNSFEERALIQGVSGRQVPGVVVGVGSEIPERTQPWRFRKKFNIKRPFAIYIGRIDANKGCQELFDYFRAYAGMYPRGLDLVLVGSKHLEIPSHPRIRHVGFLSDEDKFDGLAAADVLVMPSSYESLSMVALEAWALGKPVLANGRCDVLRGQSMRSNAGLYYETVEEFAEALFSLEASGPLGAILGRNGLEFFKRHYAWTVIERKYLDMFQQLLVADLVIADITTNNPNAFYELGIRHTVGPRGVICLHAGWADRPFDVAPQRTFKYNGQLFRVGLVRDAGWETKIAAELVPDSVPVRRRRDHSGRRAK
jgi:hypothetical protein